MSILVIDDQKRNPEKQTERPHNQEGQAKEAVLPAEPRSCRQYEVFLPFKRMDVVICKRRVYNMTLMSLPF